MAGLNPIVIMSLFATGEMTAGQEPGNPAFRTVEVLLAVEHVPEGMKIGDKIDLKMITGKAFVGKRTLHLSKTMAQGLVVESIARLEKPDGHGRSIRVGLAAPAAAAKAIEQAKAELATVVETVPGEGTTTARRPVPFRLEMAKP